MSGLTVLGAPLGNLTDFPAGEREVQRVEIRSDDLAKRVLRLQTSAGEIGLRFVDERRLRDGDVIYADDALIVVVRVAQDDVLVIRPRDLGQALEIGHALGNRHLPAQVEGGAMVVRYDPLVEELLRAKAVPHSRELRSLAEAFRHAHAPHGHE